MFRPQTIGIFIFIILFSGVISFGQKDLGDLDLTNPSYEDCMLLDSLLTAPNNYPIEKRKENFEVLVENLPD